VTGTVDCLAPEPDGDYHIWLRVDPPYQGLLTAQNGIWTCRDQPAAHLIVELIPQHCAGFSCADAGGFTNPSLPSTGEHVAVTGPLVTDARSRSGSTLGRGWTEIHPAFRIDRA